jgi:peptidyl-prolyl cis-trans isomerase B (cyclophilin B)
MKVFFALAFAFAMVGCSQSSEPQAGSGTSSPGATADSKTTAEPAIEQPADSPADQAKAYKPKDGEEVAVMETSMGRIVVGFLSKVAPSTVKNFKDLSTKGFYDGTKFHRVVPGFMIQGGDPNTRTGSPDTWGMGGSGTNIKAEFNNTHHERGILSMARSSDPNSASSQFFIVVGDAGFLDNKYTAFGRVVSGMAVADKIVGVPAHDSPSGERNSAPDNPPVLKSVKIVKWPIK